MQDRFTKIMLVVIAALLAANLLNSQGSADKADIAVQLPNILSSAQAQSSSRRAQQNENPVTYKLTRLEGQAVEDIQDVVSIGDGRTFVVSNSAGFMVYQVTPSR